MTFRDRRDARLDHALLDDEDPKRRLAEIDKRSEAFLDRGVAATRPGDCGP